MQKRGTGLGDEERMGEEEVGEREMGATREEEEEKRTGSRLLLLFRSSLIPHPSVHNMSVV